MPGLLAEFIPGSPGNKVKDVYVIETQLGTVRKQRNRVLFIVEEEIADCVVRFIQRYVELTVAWRAAFSADRQATHCHSTAHPRTRV